MKWYDYIGITATILMIISPIPQLWETWKKKTVEGLSLGMMWTLFLGCLLMGLYVFLTSKDVPLLLNYGFSVLVVGVNVYFFYKYKNK